MENLKIFGQKFYNVTGIKAKDEDDYTTITFEPSPETGTFYYVSNTTLQFEFKIGMNWGGFCFSQYNQLSGGGIAFNANSTNPDSIYDELSGGTVLYQDESLVGAYDLINDGATYYSEDYI